jgi:hypothetical protein
MAEWRVLASVDDEELEVGLEDAQSCDLLSLLFVSFYSIIGRDLGGALRFILESAALIHFGVEEAFVYL